jgi:hypothetical protein
LSKKRSKTHFKPFLSFTHTKPLVICYRIRYAHLLNPKHNTKASFALHLGLRFIFIVQRCTNFEKGAQILKAVWCTDFKERCTDFHKKNRAESPKEPKGSIFLYFIFLSCFRIG